MTRLHIPQPLSPGAALAPTLDQSRYLTQVMRLKAGDDVRVFNGKDGEWRCTLAEVLKKGAVLRAEERVRDQVNPPDVHLLIATVKKAALEFAVEKATELGAARIRLVNTARTQPQHLRLDRLDVPSVDEPAKLDAILDGWDASRRLMFCDETGGEPAIKALQAAGGASWAVLIGPEGGFTPEERDRLRALPFTTAVSLGPRVLRADTAAAAALTLWQAAIGDWDR
jgi:16S rRNA (uracil1498-N3)-methyltransferase